MAQPVFKIGPVVQPTACSVRLRGRSVRTSVGSATTTPSCGAYLPEGVVRPDPKEWDTVPGSAYEEWGIALRSRSPFSPGTKCPLAFIAA